MFGIINKRFKIIFRLKHLAANIFSNIFLLSFPNKWAGLIADRLNSLFYKVSIHSKNLYFLSNSDLLLYRSKTFHNKEPETNQWIEKIPKDGVFYDVGANVGIFTTLASLYCRNVYAFEPVALNYSVLNQNIAANKLDDIATAYCLAIGEKSEFNTMRLSSNIVGSAHHTFGSDLDACHQKFSPVFKQGCFAVALDDLIYQYQFDCPSFLKIDVDGNEHLVIAGAKKLLTDPRLKSILIELNKNLQIDQNLIESIKSTGFKLTETGEEAELNGMKIGNLIFFRN